MKKCFVIGLIMALVPNMGVFAAQKTVDMLVAEKQAKMKKLEKCKGTTKGLKIAGLSTLGVTAVGVGVNVAEAVVLDDYKGKVKKEKKEYEKQSERNKKLENDAKAKAEQAAQQEAQRQNFTTICSGLSGTVQNLSNRDWCVRTFAESVDSDKIASTIQTVDESCKNAQYNSSNDSGHLYTANCKNIDMIFNFTNVTCGNIGQEFKDGKCADKKADKQEVEDLKKKLGGDKESDNKDGAGSAKQCGDNQELIDGECKDIENQQKATERELFNQACANAGYAPEGGVFGWCYVCPVEENIAPVIRSKAYLDNALMTAARKMNVGCSGTIYTTQRQGEDFEDSNMDCVGGRIYCISKINKEATTKEQAKALLEDINNENKQKAINEKAKQVKIPFRPTEEQAKQPVPTVSFEPNVLKNMERAKEIINNDLPCKDDERFDYIMNVCVKK